MIETERRQCLEEAQLENETTGESCCGSRGVPWSPGFPRVMSPVQSMSLPQPAVGLGSGSEKSGITQQKSHKASMLS